MPRVSVILPNYNYARYLKERVTSILGQTMPDFELIYLDDASTDESNRVMHQFSGDPRLRMRLFETNSGTVYRRWNEGAAEAIGEWLWFPNADDSAHPRFLERLLALADSHPTSAVLYCRPAVVDGSGRLCSMHCNWCANKTAALTGDFFETGPEAIRHLSNGCSLSTASAMLIRRAAFVETGGFDTDLWGIADWDMYLHLLHRHDIAYTAEPLAYHRHHGSNVTSSTKALLWDFCHAVCLARAFERMRDDPRYDEDLKRSVLRRIKGRIFDVFTNPGTPATPFVSAAARELFAVVPDKRLQRFMTQS